MEIVQSIITNDYSRGRKDIGPNTAKWTSEPQSNDVKYDFQVTLESDQ